MGALTPANLRTSLGCIGVDCGGESSKQNHDSGQRRNHREQRMWNNYDVNHFGSRALLRYARR